MLNPERTRAAMPCPLKGLVILSPAIGGLGFRDCCGKALASNPILLPFSSSEWFWLPSSPTETGELAWRKRILGA